MTDTLTIASSTVVELTLHFEDGAAERLRLTIVPDAFADFSRGYLGEGTPLARAIWGKTAPEHISYTSGDIRSVQIHSVQRNNIPLPKEIADRRQQIIQQAVEEADKTNAIIFASSFSGKWGDYDPSGIIENWQSNPSEGKDDQHDSST